MSEEKITVSWKEFRKYVRNNLLQWDLLLGVEVENIRNGYGIIESIEPGGYFFVSHDGFSCKCYSFNCSLDKFEPLILSGRLAKRIKKIRKLKKRRLAKAKARKRRAEKLAQAVDREIVPFVKRSSQVPINRIVAEIQHPILTEDDVSLALHWSRDEVLRSEIDLGDIWPTVSAEYEKNWELGRLLSARVAEKAAVAFFQHHGFEVEDISIQQLYSNDLGDWTTHDLEVNGCPYDVKNARRAEHNKNTYVDHCVPKFKLNRNDEDVSIVGVLSNYLWPDSLVSPETARCETGIVVLGETNWRKIHRLKQTFESETLVVDIDNMQDSRQFLPPWLFDYPEPFYQARDVILATSAKLSYPKSRLWEYWRNSLIEATGTSPTNILPILIASGIRIDKCWRPEALADWERSFIALIASWRDEIGLSLPFLFCTILSHFLETSRSSGNRLNYHPKNYERFLFTDDVNHEYPLFIYDPLKTIETLITTLSTLWGNEKGDITSYRAFKLVGLNILRGKRDTKARWETLIAYCGGKKTTSKKCGYSPLVWGKEEHCPKCGRLICPECGYCGKDCPHYIIRMRSRE